jgi:glutaredoxin 2
MTNFNRVIQETKELIKTMQKDIDDIRELIVEIQGGKLHG